MITGETVTVHAPVAGEADPFGAPEVTRTSTPVPNVVVGPGPTKDLDATRPDGVTVVYNLHFPKTFTGSLRGALVTVRGREYAVVGDPQAYTPGNTPGAWNMPVEVRDALG